MAESEGEISFTSLQEELEYWKEKALEYRQRYVCCTPYNSLCEKCVCVCRICSRYYTTCDYCSSSLAI